MFSGSCDIIGMFFGIHDFLVLAFYYRTVLDSIFRRIKLRLKIQSYTSHKQKHVFFSFKKINLKFIFIYLLVSLLYR